MPVMGIFIGLIIGVDRLLDMTRTAVNITGDAMVACVVGKSEQKFDQEIYCAFEFRRIGISRSSENTFQS